MNLRFMKPVVLSMAFWAVFSLPAQAANDVSGNDCDWQSTASSVWEATKGAVGSAGSWLKDKGTDIYEAGKEKAPEVKENIQNGVQQASAEFSEFRADQEEQFWDWFENQTNSEVTSEPSPTPVAEETETPIPEEAVAEPVTPPVEQATSAPTEQTAPAEVAAAEAPEDQTGREPDEHGALTELDRQQAADESARHVEVEPEVEPFRLEMWQVVVGIFAIIGVIAVIGDICDRFRRHKRR